MKLFSILGPVMIGPSSSHTAGAARIGRIVRQLLGQAPVSALVRFHGSFQKTWRGHGTDRAVVGGLLGMEVDDDRLRGSLALAGEAGLKVEFDSVDLKNAHPNTIVILAEGESARIEVTASSVGGGNIIIVSIDGLPMSFTGDANTLIIRHRDMPGVIADVSGILASAKVNIATMRVSRQAAGGDAIMTLELDNLPPPPIIEALNHMREIHGVTMLKKQGEAGV